MNINNVKRSRKEVVRFAKMMEFRLRENDHKGGWRGMQRLALWNRALAEMLELRDELLKPRSHVNVIREAADVANFVMMIADKELEPA